MLKKKKKKKKYKKKKKKKKGGGGIIGSCPHVPVVVEDEYHFILECEKHQLIREEYLKYYRKRPLCFKLVQLLSSQNIKELNNLGKYLCISEKLRNDTFYFVLL
jgi:hypothetical protein